MPLPCPAIPLPCHTLPCHCPALYLTMPFPCLALPYHALPCPSLALYCYHALALICCCHKTTHSGGGQLSTRGPTAKNQENHGDDDESGSPDFSPSSEVLKQTSRNRNLHHEIIETTCDGTVTCTTWCVCVYVLGTALLLKRNANQEITKSQCTSPPEAQRKPRDHEITMAP